MASSAITPDIDIGNVADWPEEIMDTLASASLQELLDTVLTLGCDLEEDQDQAQQISAIEQQLQLIQRSIITSSASASVPPPLGAMTLLAQGSGGGVIRSAVASSNTMGPGGQQQHHRILQQQVSLPGGGLALKIYF